MDQFLSIIDGYDQLNNIFVIGTTNRKDKVDPALLRPGRLEVFNKFFSFLFILILKNFLVVQILIEIGLPDQAGREQILKIHTAKLRSKNKIASDVDLVVRTYQKCDILILILNTVILFKIIVETGRRDQKLFRCRTRRIGTGSQVKSS